MPQRTMLGMPAVAAPEPASPAAGTMVSPGSSPAPAAASTTSSKPKAQSHRTMLGMPTAQPMPGSEPPAGAANASPGFESPANTAPGTTPPVSGDAAEPPARSSVSGWLWAVLVVLLTFLVGSAGFALWLLWPSRSDVSVSVVATGTGDALRVDVPSADSETRVRFRDEEHAVELQAPRGGFVLFPLEVDDLQVGDNDLELMLVQGSETETVATTLEVAYRVRADLESLTQSEPAVAIVVHAVPDSEVTIDGAAVSLDEVGRGQVTVPVTPNDTHEDFVRDFSYRIRVPGADGFAEGSVQVSLPRATLELDRPGAELITDQRELDVAGAAHHDAVVTVDGAPVELVSGRFSVRLPLAEIRTYSPAVVAREPNKAPRSVTPEVRRVDNLATEAAAYEVDSTVDYAHLLQNPSTYVGRRVAMEGRVYNVNVERGESVLQLLVRDCPPTERCPLWVTYPAATDATVNDWVRVVGMVGGEQRFRSENGGVLTVPRVDARFVLPGAAGRSRR